MKGKREVAEITIKPAAGGVTTETRHKVSRGGQGGGPAYDHEQANAIHPDMKSLRKHLNDHLGHCFSGGGEPKASDAKDES